MKVLTHFPLLEALGWALFNSLWQMAALWLLYFLFVAFFQSATVRHRFALFFLAAGAIWTGISFITAWLFPGNVGSFILSILSPVRAAPDGYGRSARRLVEAALPFASSSYLLILGGLLVRYCANYRRSRRLTRLGLSSMPPHFRTFVTSTALQLGIRMPVKAWLSSLIDVPLTIGFLKPVILLPAAVILHLSPQQVEAILVHELAHIRRKDYFLHLLVTVLGGLFFFNPFARLLIRELKKERENSCDDLVLQFRYDAHAYVSALLSLASRRQPVHRLAVAATGTGEKMLLQRAKRILLRQKGARLRSGARPLLLLIFTMVITTMTSYHPLSQARKPAVTTAARPGAVHYIWPNVSNPLQQNASLLARAGQRFARTTITAVTPQTSTSMTLPAAITAIHPADMAFGQPIILTIAPMSSERRPARSGTFSRRSHTNAHARAEIADIALIPYSEGLLVNTADDDFLYDNSDGEPAAVAVSGEPDANAANDADRRDFSMNIPRVARPGGKSLKGMPFVPNSSFSFQYTLTDSTRQEEQLQYLQQSAQLEVLGAMANLQQQTAARLNALSAQLSKASESVRLRKEIRARQMQLQEDYFRKIMSWQNKLQKATHIRMIVYI